MVKVQLSTVKVQFSMVKVQLSTVKVQYCTETFFGAYCIYDRFPFVTPDSVSLARQLVTCSYLIRHNNGDGASS